MYKCYSNKVTSGRGCAKENPVGIRNDTVTVKGKLLLRTTGRPGREISVEPSQENCLIVRF